MTLNLDEADYATIQREIAKRQQRSRAFDCTTRELLPDGESCLAGAILAEVVRDLDDYRDLFDARRRES